MQTQSPVESQNEEVEVVAQSETCSQCYLLGEVLQTEARILEDVVCGIVIVVLIEIPYVTGIEEDSTVEAAKQLAAILQVAHQFDVAILQEVGVGFVVYSWEGARSYGTDSEGSDTVGTTHIEHLAVG